MIRWTVTIVYSLLLLTGICSCARSMQQTIAEKKDCKQILRVIEENLFYSCPISKSPADVVLHLDKLEGFVRNKEYDFGNGSVRYNARNAKLNSSKLVDEKSLFLINHTTGRDKESKFILFQAIYYFESETEKNLHYTKILEVLDKELQLKHEIRYDLLKNPYLRYNIPCNSGINIKQSGKRNDRYFIDVLWSPTD